MCVCVCVASVEAVLPLRSDPVFGGLSLCCFTLLIACVGIDRGMWGGGANPDFDMTYCASLQLS